MLLPFQFIRNGHTGRINVAKRSVRLFQPDTAPVLSAPFRAGPKRRELEKAYIDKMLVESIIKSSQTERAAHIVIVLKKDGTLQIYVDYCKLNAVRKRDSYDIFCKDEFIDLLCKQPSIRR